MFLSNLSTAKELASSQKGSGGRSSGGSGAGTGGGLPSSPSSSGRGGGGKQERTQIVGFDDDEVFTRPCDESLTLAAEGSKPLLFGPSAEGADESQAIPREVILDYFRDCSALMLDPSSLARIVGMSESKGIPLHFAAMEFQRNVMEYNFQIEPNYGCAYLSRIPNHFPNDEALKNAAKNFMFTALRSYVEAVKHRSEQFGGALRSAGGFSRTNIMEFFEACNAKMAMPETKEFLRTSYAQTKQNPGEKVILIQRRMLERFGVTADYGVSCLNKISVEMDKDAEVIQKMQQFGMCAQTACREATFTDAEREAFYAEIPIFMHHAPYMYAAHKQAEMQREMQKHQMMMQDEMQRLRAEPGSLPRLESFAARVKAVQPDIIREVQTWSTERRETYFNDFKEAQLLRDVMSGGAGLVRRFETFSAFSDAQVRDMMTLSAVIAEDLRANAQRGPLFMRSNNNGVVQNVLQSWAALVRAGQQSSAQNAQTMDRSTAAGSMNRDHEHDAGHGQGSEHVHGPNCKHGGGTTMDHGHDVTSGEAARMER